MSRARPDKGLKDKRLGDLSGAGLLVVGTLCACLVLTVATVCLLAYQSPEIETPAVLDRLAAAFAGSVATLLAKTYVDSRRAADDPTTVSAPPDATVTVKPAPGGAEDPVAGRI